MAGGPTRASAFRITGHYFSLVTLALSGIVLQVITATRDHTGGSLGYTPERYQGGSSLFALQFGGKDDVVPDRARRVGRRACGSGTAWTAACCATHWRRSPRTRTPPPPPGCHVTAREAQDHGAERGHDRGGPARSTASTRCSSPPNTVQRPIAISLQMVFAVGGGRHLRLARPHHRRRDHDPPRRGPPASPSAPAPVGYDKPRLRSSCWYSSSSSCRRGFSDPCWGLWKGPRPARRFRLPPSLRAPRPDESRGAPWRRGSGRRAGGGRATWGSPGAPMARLYRAGRGSLGPPIPQWGLGRGAVRRSAARSPRRQSSALGSARHGSHPESPTCPPPPARRPSHGPSRSSTRLITPTGASVLGG